MRRARSSASDSILAPHLIPQYVQSLLAVNVALRQLTGRKDRLADVLCVVLHALVHILAVDDAILLVDFAVIITEKRIEQMLVSFSFISYELGAAK